MTSPIQGTVVSIEATVGEEIAAGQSLAFVEAMKMEQPLTAHKSGTVTSLSADVGAAVTPGSVICELKD